QLPFERLACTTLVASSQAHETAQPVQCDAAETRRAGLLTCLAGDAGIELALGLVEGLPRDVHRRREPVRERKAGEQRGRAACLTQPLFSPTHGGKTQVMAPVVGFERDRAA